MNGPIGVAEYMQSCLSHPEHGYYSTRDPLGSKGDFITAPEVSQMFGEMIGMWIVSLWQAAEKPNWQLIELGPGRGTMMADILKTAKAAEFEPDVWMIETSPKLREAQKERVPEARWAEGINEIPPGPAVILANEFFDALPVKQYLRSDEGWRERQVGVVETKLGWGLSGAIPAEGDVDSDWVEISPLGDTIAEQINDRIKSEGGLGLIIDYGYQADNRPEGPTLQAVQRHKKVDPLVRPGKVDLTFLVDFDRLIGMMPDVDHYVTEQGPFLMLLGIGQRAEALAEANAEAADDIADALERLTRAEQMGSLFKVLSVLPKGQEKPPGF
ncbi:MAG: SAM-dependent methyltransferase [Pseudomonadota bacterium]